MFTISSCLFLVYRWKHLPGLILPALPSIYVKIYYVMINSIIIN